MITTTTTTTTRTALREVVAEVFVRGSYCEVQIGKFRDDIDNLRWELADYFKVDTQDIFLYHQRRRVTRLS